MKEKKQYIAPNLTEFGTIEQLTQGTSSGENLDSTFPVHTPFRDLTFS